jgi:excisionase family DNA binding protein
MGRKKQASTAQPLLLSVAEVAIHLGVCRQTVYNLIYDGSLPSVKIRGLRRISRSSLDDWLRQLETA